MNFSFPTTTLLLQGLVVFVALTIASASSATTAYDDHVNNSIIVLSNNHNNEEASTHRIMSTSFLRGLRDGDDDDDDDDDDDCNQQESIVALIQNTTGIECFEPSIFPGEYFTLDCLHRDEKEDGTSHTVQLSYEAMYDINDADDVAVRSILSVHYGELEGGGSSGISFSNDCTKDDLQNAQEFLNNLTPPKTQPPSADSTEENVAGCSQHKAIVSLLQDTTGIECFEPFIIPGESFTLDCLHTNEKEDGTTHTVVLSYEAIYNNDDADDVTVKSILSVHYELLEGGGFSGISFSNDCTEDDLQNAQDFLNDLTPPKTQPPSSESTDEEIDVIKNDDHHRRLPYCWFNFC